MSDLKPCPFCGGNAYKATGAKGDGQPWQYVECEECAASADSHSAWNKRHVKDLTPTMADRIEEQEAKLAKALAYNRFWSGEMDTVLALRDDEEDRAEIAEAKLAKAVEALDKLARLGNGEKPGNSDGNMIARAAIAEINGGQP